MKKKRLITLIILLSIATVFVFFWIRSQKVQHGLYDSPANISDSILFATAPVLSPEQAVQTIRLPEDFRIEIVATEPMIQDPIAMTFDGRGRIWVVEMQSYMQNLDENREGEKISRIVILEDHDGDGRMDHSKVFLDSLVMPRALALVEGGVLYAEPPNLWFVENVDDRPGQKVLVDSAYAVGGNPEHQPNGLLRGMDNWYYNAKSKFRYKHQDGQWLKEETEFRGQWGISTDNYGRLYYNTNSNQLRGDLVPPNTLNRNPDFEQEMGVNVEIAKSQRVYPIRPTPGINRGYKEEMLDETNRLLRFTAACSPLIYRGDRFPDDFQGNAFVCEPAGNLIKRNVLTDNGPYTTARDAYDEKEFLASTDERFRPVSLSNGPDGNLYVVDMYRGVIQHETFITDYLRNQIRTRELEKPIGLGRIYRIVYEGNEKEAAVESSGTDDKTKAEKANKQFSGKSLISLLSHPNGWWRDYVQQVLIEQNDQAIVPELMAILEAGRFQNYNQIHALWILKGMDLISPEVVRKGLKSENPQVRAVAIRVGEQFNEGEMADQILALYKSISATRDPVVDLQLTLSLGYFMEVDSATVMKLLKSMVDAYGNEPLFLEAAVSSLYQYEANFLKLLHKGNPAHQEMIKMLSEVIAVRKEKKELASKDLSSLGEQQYLAGKPLYERICAGCHGVSGEGLVPIAPPLKQSEWVLGSEDRLISIILHGLKGPVHVNGKLYKEPEIQPMMPGLKENQEISDKDMAALLTYIRNSWGNSVTEVNDSTVSAVRKRSMDRTEPYTQEELLSEWDH